MPCPAENQGKAEAKLLSKRRERLPFDLPNASGKFLKLRCSIPQSDSFFKRTFFKKPLILKKV